MSPIAGVSSAEDAVADLVGPGPIPFADDLERHGERTALIAADGSTLSYAALAAAADAVPLPPARTLAVLAIQPTIDSIVTYLALLRRRHPVILVDSLDSAVGRSIAATYAPWCPGQAVATAGADTHPDLAVLLSTSGSTGSPKLVRLSRANIAANAESIAAYLGLTADDRAITSLPLHYSYGLSVLHSHLAVGAGLVLTDASVADAGFWTLFERHGATHLAHVPHGYELFERSGFRDRTLPSLRLLTQAGGRLPQALVETYADWAAARGVRFFVMYGQTEATARIAWLPPETARANADCIGIAIPGGELGLRGVDGTDAGDGPGELVFRGPNVMMGYAGCPADLARGPELAELATGDIAERTPAGLFRIVGRMSRFSKLFGLRISHDEVERQLAGDGLTALVTGDDAGLVIAVEGEVPAGLAARIAGRNKLPVQVVRVAAVAALPRLPSGKPDYAAVRALAAPPPSGVVPRSVAAVFAEAFPGVDIRPHESFSSLGGDSLNYVTFAMALEDVIGPLPADWPDLTLAQLAAREGDAPRRDRWWRGIDGDIVLRAVAICAVVLVHTGIMAGVAHQAGPAPAVGGGALALMILFGFNLARFQQPRLSAGRGTEVLSDFLLRVMLPYVLFLVAYSVGKQRFDLPSLLLVSNWFGRFGGMLEPYWFLEVAVQAMLATALLFAVPGVRTAARENPLRLAWLLLGSTLALKAVGAMLLDQQHLAHRTLDANLFWLALGWLCTQRLAGWQKPALVLLATGIAVLDWGWSTRIGWVTLTVATLLYVPRLVLPRPLVTGLAMIARASFMIYLTHLVVINVFELRLGIVAPWVELALAIALGVVAAAVWEWLLGLAGRVTRSAALAKPGAPAA